MIGTVIVGAVLFAFGFALAAELSPSLAKTAAVKAHPDISVTKADSSTAAAPLDLQARMQNGEFLIWAYQITNTGNVELTNVHVTDDQLGKIDCPSSSLTAGESMICAGGSSTSSGLEGGKGCATGDHIFRSDAGVLVTTKGDCADQVQGISVPIL